MALLGRLGGLDSGSKIGTAPAFEPRDLTLWPGPPSRLKDLESSTFHTDHWHLNRTKTWKQTPHNEKMPGNM